MRRLPTPLLRSGRTALLLGAVLSCNDFLTGQDEEPPGPLQATRVTLLDSLSRQASVFTDTLAPLDCALPDYTATTGCMNDPLRDRYSKTKSPPTPDSAQEIRVVFNKVPLLLGGMPVEDALARKGAVDLRCDGCTGVPAFLRRLIIFGSQLSGDPLTSPYGPAILMGLDPADKRAALEPDTAYTVQIDPALSGRDGTPIGQVSPAGTAVLQFRTEPFKVLQVGTGASTDAWVYSGSTIGAGTAADPYRAGTIPQNGALVLKLNAPLDATLLSHPDNITAAVRTTPVKVRAFLARYRTDHCDPEGAHRIYLFPDSPNGTWDGTTQTGDLRITIADLQDLSQDAAHTPGQGRHHLSGLTVTASLSGAVAAQDYAGLVSLPGLDCPGPVPKPAAVDMGGADLRGADLGQRDLAGAANVTSSADVPPQHAPAKD